MKYCASKSDLRKSTQIRVPRDYPWRVLDTLIEDLSDCLTKEEVTEVKRIIRKRDYAAYTQLSETMGPQSITSCDTDASKVFARYQVAALLKKFQFPSDANARKAAALKKFWQAEEACAEYNQTGCKALAFLEDETELHIFTYAKHFLERVLGSVLPERKMLTLWSRHGPGANLDTVGGAVSLYDKYANWPYSCTTAALRHARLSIMDDERWLGALEDSYRRKHEIPMHAILDQERFWASVLQVVPGNRITFVPKNSQTDRSIAIEPCMNLYLQLGVDGYIRRRLKRWGVDLDDQSKNQRLAGIGSRCWEDQDSYVTLDLAAASDSISLRVCELLLPPQWYSYLVDLRSPSGECEGEVISYEKISSMGNGYTFALESAIFAAIIYGVERVTRGKFEKDHVAIFGDDLIVRKKSAALVTRMLNRCGFSINPEKSFTEGPFRESCGADWLRGTPVRPVFLDSNPSTVMELWGDANRLRRILSLRRWGFEFKVVSLIESWVPQSLRGYVGPLSDEDFDSYMHSPTPVTRWKKYMWTFQRIVVVPKPLKGENFLFRKLMHSLRQEPETPERFSRWKWGGAQVRSGAGSRYTVTSRNAITVRNTSSSTSIWSSEYSETYAMPLRGLV